MAKLGALTYDSLIAGPQERIITDAVVIAAGQSLKRGAILGRVTADGTFKLCDATAKDGSENICAILVEDVDSGSGAAPGVVYFEGEFNAAALVVKAGENIGVYRWPARAMGIYFRNIVQL